ncbi:MAG: UDP-N-acetylmuramoyl-L-alanyl-D-glutamate--2,6-diaminopimelate ligase [Armatimonadetes bacterium]|nr:UDP-N-acetylmuramoyl-L-alanyl-D-glutamate--2,6-diaminopimelate ligase [Armatimonadota bacterium]
MPLISELGSLAGVTFDALSGDAEVLRPCEDSRLVQPGDLFISMPSPTGDTHRFLPGAKDAGAAAALTHSREGFEQAVEMGIPALLIEDKDLAFAEGLWRICKLLNGNPAATVRVIGVTGTNGKTTTACVIRDALNALGRRAAYLGTLGFQTPDKERELSNTTPFAPEVWRLLAEARDSNCTDMVMEVSSHALEQRRVDGIEFDAAVFTNLTQDHLDFHGSMEAYERAKWRLYSDLPAQSKKRFVGALNVDDPVGREWTRHLLLPTITFGMESGELRGGPIRVGVDQIKLWLGYGGKDGLLESALGGNFNVRNLLSACSGLLAVGYSLAEAIQGLRAAKPVPGRFEAVLNDAGIGILVDYAHTPDALEKLLISVRELNPKRMIVVFGCGGDRDRTKRPKMAAVVSRLADFAVVTSDNPRTEDPAAILAEVAAASTKAALIIDRREAVAFAIKLAEPGDIVVIAGKGHENYQIIGRTKYPMDDRELAREGLAARAAKG